MSDSVRVRVRVRVRIRVRVRVKVRRGTPGTRLQLARVMVRVSSS